MSGLSPIPGFFQMIVPALKTRSGIVLQLMPMIVNVLKKNVYVKGMFAVAQQALVPGIVIV